MSDSQTSMREMLAVHDCLRKEFASLPLNVKGTPEDGAERAAIVGGHVMMMTAMLNAHHEGEDAILWPLLRERAPQTVDLVDEMEAQHERMVELLQRAQAQTQEWMSNTNVQTRSALHTTLIALEREVLAHLAHEETDVLPVAVEVVSYEEFSSMGRHAQASMTPEQMAIGLGMIVDDTTEDNAAAILDSLPPDVRAYVEGPGREIYQGYRDRLFDRA
jgi:iron-sulfur cluster repair protein YtfE (RIC family)